MTIVGVRLSIRKSLIGLCAVGALALSVEPSAAASDVDGTAAAGAAGESGVLLQATVSARAEATPAQGRVFRIRYISFSVCGDCAGESWSVRAVIVTDS